MQKRTFLATLGTAITTSTAGCLGYTIADQSDINHRKQRIQALNSRTTELEDRLAHHRDTLSRVNNTLNERNTRLDRLTDQASQLENRVHQTESNLVLTHYAIGKETYNQGKTAQNAGSQSWNDDDYEDAFGEYNLAVGYFASAETNFRRAETHSDEFGFDTVEVYCNDAKVRTRNTVDAMDFYRTAAQHMLNGKADQANFARIRGDDALNTAHRNPLREVDLIEDELGVELDT